MSRRFQGEGLPGSTGPSKTALIVEVRNADGTVVTHEDFEVVRPPGPVRQREQLARMVTSQFPDAHPQHAADGRVTFVVGSHVVTSAYADALQPAPEPTDAGRRTE